MVNIRIIYLVITGIFLFFIAFDSSVLNSLGIVRFLPYLFVATFVLISSRSKLSRVQKGLFLTFILLIGIFIFLIGSLSGIGCLGGMNACEKELYDHLKISMLFFLISAGVIAFLPPRTSKKSK